MAKQQILLVDADSSSARLLEVSLRSAGFTVATADSAEAALAKLEHGTPDLILTDTALPKADGFSFVRKLRARPESASVPVVFLTEQGALEDKLRGLELGVDDYLAKPIFVREVVTRVQLLLARKRQRIAPEPARTRFSGSLEDVAVVDLLQTIAVSGKSGVASVRRGDREAWLYFDRGQVIDAEVGDLRGEEAVYRTISWTTGSFDLEFRACDRAKVIDAPYQALLMEGLRRVDELGRIAEQLPPEDAVIDLDHSALASRLNEIPDELNAILRLIDGKRTLLDLIDASPFDDLSTLTVLSKFYFEGLISSIDVNPEGSERPASDAPLSARNGSSAPPRDIGEVATLVPPSRSTPAAAIPTVPPARVPQTSPPSTVPADVEPPREARRETPAPITARAATPIEGKLTPKGIVNVGEHGASPSKAAPAKGAQQPFRVVDEQPRRSPIPMPDGSLRGNGAARSNGALLANGAQAEELRQTRTSLGLSASTLQRPPPVTVEYPKPPAPAALDEPERRPAAAAVASAPEAAPAAAHAHAAEAHAPGSSAEPEQEFFEAGDEGTYQGGPLSEVPELRLARDSVEPAPPPPRRPVVVRSDRARRGKLIVAGILLLASAPLVIGLTRRLSSRTESAPSPEPSAVAPVPAPPLAAPAPPPVVPAPAPVEPTPPAAAPAAPATPPAEPVAPVAATPPAAPAPVPPPPAKPATTPPAAVSKPPLPAPARPVPPRATKPAPRATKPAEAPAPAAAPAPAPAPSRPAPLPLDLPMLPQLPKPGEKPPTAAYPLR